MNCNDMRYPLCWPEGYPRAEEPIRDEWPSRLYSKTQRGYYLEMMDEFRKLGSKYQIVSTNCPLKVNGEPYTKTLSVCEDSGVAVYFEFNGDEYVIATDRYRWIGKNYQLIAKCINAIRVKDDCVVGDWKKCFSAKDKNGGFVKGVDV